MTNKAKRKGCLHYLMIAFFIRFIVPFAFILLFGIFGVISDLISSSWSDDIYKKTTTTNTIKPTPKSKPTPKAKPRPKPKPTPKAKPRLKPEKYFEKNTYWKTNFGPKHRGLIKTKENDYYSSINNRKKLSVYNNWKYNAQSVIRNDQNRLNGVISIFNRIKRDKRYNRYEFADLIVSFVQDIPYSLIDNDLDIYAPVEFIKKYKGDCDTKTILLYILLKKFDYDVVILNSWQYKHSIIGVNLPTNGNSYKYYKGKRYYAWETTYPGWILGNIPPKVFNMNHWEIGLY